MSRAGLSINPILRSPHRTDKKAGNKSRLDIIRLPETSGYAFASAAASLSARRISICMIRIVSSGFSIS